jgi:hypothetical protein
VVIIALPGTGNRGHDVEVRYADSVRDVCLVLAEEAPQHGCEPDLQPPPYPSVNVVLVVPEFVRELLALNREGDWNDGLSESPAVPVVRDAAWVAEPVTRIYGPPAGGAYARATRENRDQVVTVRLAELEDRGHDRSGPDEVRRLGREPLQASEHVIGRFDDSDPGT